MLCIGNSHARWEQNVAAINEANRSKVMRSIKSQNTGAEMIVHRLLYGSGFRYRLHRADLPGKPDIVFPGRKKVIFVHGCFWHLHPDPRCPDAKRPKSNTSYWSAKLDRNVERDRESIAALEEDGWQVLVVWECQIRDTAAPNDVLQGFLSVPASNGGNL